MRTVLLKAIADETRLKIITFLLGHNYCVRALAKQLEISEAAVSQHLKILREAGLLIGEKKGYFMHYDVNRNVLRDLAHEIHSLADIERKVCLPKQGVCQTSETVKCNHQQGDCSDEVREFCHGHSNKHSCHCKRHENGADEK